MWQQITASQLTGSGNPFGSQLLHVQHNVAAGTAFSHAAGTITRTLNTTVTSEITSASLSSNQITLPAGTYYVDAWALLGAFAQSYSSYTGANGKAWFLNVTDNSVVLNSSNIYVYAGGDFGQTVAQFCPVQMKGRFTISGTKIFELRSNTTYATSFTPTTLTSPSVNEVFSEVMIWKVA